MSEALAKPPIVEAVVDIECDMPPALDLEGLDAGALAAFRDHYPVRRKQIIQAHKLEGSAGVPPTVSFSSGIHALQFFTQDEKQLVQVRAQGFSFNRLAPYTSLDDYLPEIERTWRLFVDLARPTQVRLIRLRYINQILLPAMEEGSEVEVGKYLQIPWRLPLEGRLAFAGFLSHFAAVEAATGHRVKVVFASQPADERVLPLIFDIETAAGGIVEPADWPAILAKVASLRDLKNAVFRSTLTDACLQLFRG